MTESELIEGLLQGEKKYLRTFYKEYSPRLKNFILQRVSDRHDAEEILQDTLLDSLDAMRDFSGESSLYTYICAIAKHKTIDYYRRKRIKKVVFSRLPAAENIVSILTTPEEVLDEQLTQEKVQDILSSLRPKYRKALKLKYLRGFSVKQVAKKMSISFKSAESILFRARKEFALAYENRSSVSTARKKA